MSINLFLYGLFLCTSIITSMMVISVVNPVHSVLFLILVYVSVTGVLLLIRVEFLGIIFIVVYVGAVAVLLLFVVMMLNIRSMEVSESGLKYLPVGVLIGCIFLCQVLLLLYLDYREDASYYVSIVGTNLGAEYIDWCLNLDVLGNTKLLGSLLYTYYLYYFFMSSFILLVSMIGAIALTLGESLSVKKQKYFEQVFRNSYQQGLFLNSQKSY